MHHQTSQVIQRQGGFMSIFDKYKKESLTDYLNVCNMFADIDMETDHNIALNTIKYYRGNKSLRNELRSFQELEAKWYRSLDNKNPDYSLYDDKFFLFDAWACWVIYSRKYLRTINAPNSLFNKSIVSDIGPVKSVIDLGCGFGYTTAALKELFPDAVVIGTNLETSIQYKVASFFTSPYHYSLLSDFHSLDKVDLVFASEYFEHFEEPISHLKDVIKTLNPDYLIIANAFNTISIGHFREYKHEDISMDGRKINRAFNKCLRDHHYEKVKTKCWNNRPTYWRKIKPLYESGDIL
jgi:SAM-dependent methyltransferase